MTINADYIIAYNRIKQKLNFWKLLSIVLFIAIFLMLVNGKLKNIKHYVVPNSNISSSTNDYIATIDINGILFEDAKRDKKINEIYDNDSIKALIVHINSPGGTVVGSEKIYNILKKITDKKPVVVVMGTLATSGGYLVSLAADHIICHNGTITGSIGVIMQSAEITELAEKLGIKFTNFKSSPLKAAPNYNEKVTPEVEAAIMQNIGDTYEYFTSLVATRRKLPIDVVKNIADGRIYSGSRALQLKLVDQVGTDDDAIKWLSEEKNISADLPIKEINLSPKQKIIDMLLDDLNNLIQGISSKFLAKGNWA